MTNLGQVTEALLGLLHQNINSRFGIANVTAVAPERLAPTLQSTLSLHLYHVAEEPHTKSLPPLGNPEPPPVAQQPLALSLFYVLTAHHRPSADQTSDDAIQQHKLLGWALKTLHDFPHVDAQTQVNGVQIGAGLDENELHIILRPLTPEDAVDFWTTEDSRTAMVSAYYEVRVVRLDPEPPQSLPGVILSLGAYPVPGFAPHLARTESGVAFVLPAVAGGTPQAIRATPGRVSVTDGMGGPPDNLLLVLGSDLASPELRVVLRGGELPAEGIEIPTVNGVGIVAWDLKRSADRIEIAFRDKLRVGGPPIPLPPGAYTASVRRTEGVREGPLGPIALDSESNQVGFLIVPRISDATVKNAAPLQIELHLLAGVDLSAVRERITLAVGSDVHLAVDDVADLDHGTYVVTDADEILFQPSFGNAPGTYPVRLIVNGAEAQPYWIEQ